jgi:uncharacterized membrane protein (UPF0127 family)
VHRPLASLLLSAAVALPSPNPSLPVTYVRAPAACLTLETATTPQEQERGLMSRTSLPVHTGMLFVFDRDDPVSFWMKDTLVPLDMIFVASNLRVRQIFARVPPVPSGTPDEKIRVETASARYVIELPSGEAARDGIARGAQLLFSRERCR